MVMTRKPNKIRVKILMKIPKEELLRKENSIGF
jgi:hypothetical protein